MTALQHHLEGEPHLLAAGGQLAPVEQVEVSIEHMRGLVAGQLGVQGRLLLGLQHLAAGSMITFISSSYNSTVLLPPVYFGRLQGELVLPGKFLEHVLDGGGGTFGHPVVNEDVGARAPVGGAQGHQVYCRQLHPLAAAAQGALQGRPVAPPDVPHGPGVVGSRPRYYLELFNFDINDIRNI